MASTRHSEIAQTLSGIVGLFQIGNVLQGIIILFYFSHVMLCQNALGKNTETKMKNMGLSSGFSNGGTGLDCLIGLRCICICNGPALSNSMHIQF